MPLLVDESLRLAGAVRGLQKNVGKPRAVRDPRPIGREPPAIQVVSGDGEDLRPPLQIENADVIRSPSAFVGREASAVRGEMYRMVSPVGPSHDLGMAAPIDPNDFAPGGNSRSVHQRPVRPDAKLWKPAAPELETISELDRIASSLEGVDVEGHRRKPHGSRAGENEMPARHVQGVSSREENPVLLGVRR